ncbi:MAG: tellurite resistance/C4-dicarboxylate transporter family protein [Pseudonocardia sp.]|nr:tellurite resistance/C4-dicarboxylate transporter family protein [Pseudonocardia sp.]
MGVVVRIGAQPPDSFAVVMATGIVSVAARDSDYPAISAVLAVLAGAALLVLAVLAGVRRAVRGRAFAEGPDPLTHTFALFTFVAACDVLDARIGYERIGIVGVLSLVALVAWLAIGAQLSAALRAVPAQVVGATARGGWLLAAVATHSLALAAAQLAGVGVAVTPLLVLSILWWVLGLLAYVPIAGLVVARLRAARLAPEVLTPDLWVLMGALSIATVAGGALTLVSERSPAFGWLPGVLVPVLVVVWAVAGAWIPLLVAAEVRRARWSRPRYERARWSTVFPLGMYSSACFVLAAVLTQDAGGATTFTAALLATSHTVFWVAVAAWGATAVGLTRRGWRALRPADPR